jgi:ribosomal protein S18 acetylase RimI-like enzyme
VFTYLEAGVAKIAQTDQEIGRCYDTMSALRPHLRREEFVHQVRQMQVEGYQLAYIEHAGEVVSVAGYRISTNFYLGKHLYVDDLVTSEKARSNGHGERLLDWLRTQARDSGCRYIDLDSGTQRGGAHKFYFRHGFTILAYHFGEQLDAP